MLMVNKILRKKVKGFGGVTHVLLAITLLLLMLIYPFPYFKDFVGMAQESTKYFLIFLFIVSGAALLPDLDNDESTAGYQLGIFGSLIKVFMKTTAYIVYSVYNLKNDQPPKSMHRLLWHTPLIGLLILLYFVYFSPEGNQSYWNLITSTISNGTYTSFAINHIVTTVIMIIAYLCAVLGSNIILYWPMKILPFGNFIKSMINNIVPILILIFLLNIPIYELQYIGIAIGLGYIFHLVGDIITQGSVPLIWPIPWNGKAWNKPNILGPFQIRTGGIVNTIINFVLLGLNLFLLISVM